MDTYNPSEVEKKWQDRWSQENTNSFTQQDLLTAERPFYNLMMFPYPSAEGLHIGNIFAYTGADVHGRYRRLSGDDVFQPMGFDAFGIHSENFALKMGVPPNELIPRNIENFRQQLNRIGAMFDWRHSVDTTDVAYYRWTQWLFVTLFKAGLIERRERAVNWCPSCMTVLANEQVIDGRCERCDASVETRKLPQWFIKISQYAERLLANLETLDWSETTRKAQVSWIGKSEGAEVDFQVVGTADVIRVFTTRPDTLFGATYMVLAPEHEFVERIAGLSVRNQVLEYVDHVAKRDLVQRKKEGEKKTGVFTGAYCVNPANGRQIPVWVADYVLVEYGTGAIMAVPGHDERDFEFASTFDLPIVRVIAGPGESASTPLNEAYTSDGVLVNSGGFDGLDVAEAKAAIVASLAKHGRAKATVSYRLHDWCISRQRYWGPPIPVIHCETCGTVPVPEEELPVELPRLDDYRPDESGLSPLARDQDWCRVDCPECGSRARRDTDVSDTFLDSGWYFLRYPCTDTSDAALDPELIRKWLPVHCYIGGNEHAVLHLLYARFLTMALCDLGLIEFEEPFVKFRAHGLLVRDGKKISKSRGNVVIPKPIIDEYGADTMRLYLMFLGPYEQGGDFRTGGIQGPHGFLRRLWQSVAQASDEPGDAKVMQALHKTIRAVQCDTESLQFNTAIAAMMEYLNLVRAGGRRPKRGEVEPLVVLVSPYAPHIAEELYERLGNNGGLFASARWPVFDEDLTRVKIIEIGVQVNGKRRGSIEIAPDADEESAVAAAMEHGNVGRYVAGNSIKKTIYVPGRMLSLVVGR